MNKYVVLVFLLLASSANAWDWDTHEYMGEEICRDFECGCLEEIVNGSIVPDKYFKDNFRHHCYLDGMNCTESDEWDCPQKEDCPSLEQVNLWLEKANESEGCEKWKSIGIALHYYSDSYVFWHQVQKEDYRKCHESFERAIGDEIIKSKSFLWRILGIFGIERSWEICRCGVCADETNIETVIERFGKIITAD